MQRSLNQNERESLRRHALEAVGPGKRFATTKALAAALNIPARRVSNVLAGENSVWRRHAPLWATALGVRTDQLLGTHDDLAGQFDILPLEELEANRRPAVADECAEATWIQTHLRGLPPLRRRIVAAAAMLEMFRHDREDQYLDVATKLLEGA